MSQERPAASEVEIITDSICHMCTSACSTKVHVRQGRPARIDMVETAVIETCPRWTAQLDFIYHPDRLKYPLKRIGKRGTLSFQSGDLVSVSSPRGSIRLKTIVTDTILPGVVHVPHHWPGEANVNILADDQALDSISGFAPFKSQLCQIEKA